MPKEKQLGLTGEVENRVRVFFPEGQPQRLAITFPAGLGSEYLNIGNKLAHYPQAEKIYSQAEKVLGYSIRDIIFSRQEEYTDQEIHAATATFVINHICFTALRDQYINQGQDFSPEIGAGFGIGFYNTLVAAGAITFEEGLFLAHSEAAGMNDALKGGTFIMSVNPNIKDGKRFLSKSVKELQKKGFIVSAINSDHELAVSGVDAVLVLYEDYLKDLERQGITIKRLKIEVPDHTLHMELAKKTLEDAVNRVAIKDAQFPIVANTTGKTVRFASEIKKEILEQVINPIDWKRVMNAIAKKGVPNPWEVGVKGVFQEASKDPKKAGGVVAVLVVFGMVVGALAWRKRREPKKPREDK